MPYTSSHLHWTTNTPPMVGVGGGGTSEEPKGPIDPRESVGSLALQLLACSDINTLCNIPHDF